MCSGGALPSCVVGEVAREREEREHEKGVRTHECSDESKIRLGPTKRSEEDAEGAREKGSERASVEYRAKDRYGEEESTRSLLYMRLWRQRVPAY